MNFLSRILHTKKKYGISFHYEKSKQNFLMITFAGKCFAGSSGNEQGEFIYESLKRLFKKENHDDYSCFIVDFTKLEYTFGNYIFNSVSLIAKLSYPRAIIYSDKSRNLVDNRPDLFFKGLQEALDFIESKK